MAAAVGGIEMLSNVAHFGQCRGNGVVIDTAHGHTGRCQCA